MGFKSYHHEIVIVQRFLKSGREVIFFSFFFSMIYYNTIGAKAMIIHDILLYHEKSYFVQNKWNGCKEDQHETEQ